METQSPASPSWKLELVDDAPPAAGSPPVAAPGLTLVHDAALTLDLTPRPPAGTPGSDGGSAPVEPGFAAADAAPPLSRPPGPDAPSGAGRGAPGPAGDRYFADATREFVKGHVDAALWTHALARAGGDETAARAGYLKARATALKLERRERRADSMERRVQAARALADDDANVDVTAKSAGSGAPGSNSRRRMLLGAGLGIAALAVVGVFALSMTGADTAAPAGATVVAATPTATGRAAAPAVRAAGQAAAAAASAEASARALDEEFAAKVQALRDAGNWNVVVLQASEWTRRQPANAIAWGHLSAGYARLRQLDDAYETARKAVQLGPEYPHLWRNLGQVNQALNLPDEAIDAYQRAVALNDRDVESLAQLGVLNAQLGRLPEARGAFDRVLALSPEDTEALCGQASIALRQGRGKDADAIQQQLKASGRGCVDRSAPAAAPTATASAAPAKTAATGRR